MSFLSGDLEPVSYSTFVRVYHSSWQKILKFRHEGQHSKCTECEKLKQHLRITTNPADIKLIKADYVHHLESMFADRKVDSDMCEMGKDPAKKFLSLSIDSMDTAKFRIPRNLKQTKAFAALWRPEAIFTVVLSEGHFESFYFCDQDLSKDPNLMMTLLARSVHMCLEKLARDNQPHPNVLRVHSDNTPSETKNQFLLQWLASLLHRGVFREAVLTSFRVGHSHCAPDERFACVRTLLADSVELQEPSDFLARVQELKPHRGRSVTVEKVEAAYDWKESLKGLGDVVSLHGHVQTHQQTLRDEEAVHVFNLVQRENYKLMTGETLVELPGYEPDGKDIVLEVYQYLSSETMSQTPMVYIPAKLWDQVDLSSLPQIAPRRSFSDKQLAEFRKTANKVLKPPWRLLRANTYLRNLVNFNQDPQLAEWEPPEIQLALKPAPQAGEEEKPEINPEALGFANRAAAPVSVIVRKTAAKSAPKKRAATSQPDTEEKEKASCLNVSSINLTCLLFQ